MEIFERIRLLKGAPIFSSVETEDLRRLAQNLEEEQYGPGDQVFTKGETGDQMYVIQSGRVGIALEDDAPFVAELTAGDIFGEMNLLDELPRSASARVLEDTTLLSLEKDRLRGLIINYPELALGMLKSLSVRLRLANERIR